MEAGHSHTSFAMFCYVLLCFADRSWRNSMMQLPHFATHAHILVPFGTHWSPGMPVPTPRKHGASTALWHHQSTQMFFSPLNLCSIYFNLTLNLLGNTFGMPVRQAISCNFNGSNLESMTQFDQSNEGIYTELHRYLFQPVNVGLLNPK